VTMIYTSRPAVLSVVVLVAVLLSWPTAHAAVGSDTSAPITVDVVVPEVDLTPMGENIYVHGDELVSFHWNTGDDHPGDVPDDFFARVLTSEGIIDEISYYLHPEDFTCFWRVPEDISSVAWVEVYCYDLYGNLTREQSGTFTILPSTVAVPPVTPKAMYLSAPHPNPFNPTTTIAFELPAAGEATLTVYDVKGRLVRHLRAGPHAAGRYSASWDGRDDAGRRVAGEVFLAVLAYTHDGRSELQVRKMVYIP